MAKRPTNKAKVKLWTERVTMEFEGTISACALETFGGIESRQARVDILQLMTDRHQALCEYEDERAAAADKPSE